MEKYVKKELIKLIHIPFKRYFFAFLFLRILYNLNSIKNDKNGSRIIEPKPKTILNPPKINKDKVRFKEIKNPNFRLSINNIKDYYEYILPFYIQ